MKKRIFLALCALISFSAHAQRRSRTQKQPTQAIQKQTAKPAQARQPKRGRAAAPIKNPTAPKAVPPAQTAPPVEQSTQQLVEDAQKLGKATTSQEEKLTLFKKIITRLDKERHCLFEGTNCSKIYSYGLNYALGAAVGFASALGTMRVGAGYIPLIMLAGELGYRYADKKNVTVFKCLTFQGCDPRTKRYMFYRLGTAGGAFFAVITKINPRTSVGAWLTENKAEARRKLAGSQSGLIATNSSLTISDLQKIDNILDKYGLGPLSRTGINTNLIRTIIEIYKRPGKEISLEHVSEKYGIWKNALTDIREEARRKLAKSKSEFIARNSSLTISDLQKIDNILDKYELGPLSRAEININLTKTIIELYKKPGKEISLEHVSEKDGIWKNALTKIRDAK